MGPVPGLAGTVVLRGSGMGTCELCSDCGQAKAGARTVGALGGSGLAASARLAGNSRRTSETAGSPAHSCCTTTVPTSLAPPRSGWPTASSIRGCWRLWRHWLPCARWTSSVSAVLSPVPEPGYRRTAPKSRRPHPWANVTQRLSQVCLPFSAPQRPPYLPAFLETVRIKPRRTGLRIDHRVPCPLGLLGTRS